MYQCLYFSRMVRTHFDNRHFVFFCQTKQRERYTDVIIEITFCI